MTDAEYQARIDRLAKYMADNVIAERQVDIYAEIIPDPTDWEHLVEASGRPWADVGSDLARAIADLKKETHEIAAFIVGELDFEPVGTGGGCEAYQLQLPGGDPKDPPHLIITHGEDAVLPEYWGDPLLIGKYKSMDDDADLVEYPTVRAFEQAVRAGRDQFISPPSSTGPSAAASGDVASALARINTHRRSLAMSPLDPASVGWTDQDVLDEAERIVRLPNMARGLMAPR